MLQSDGGSREYGCYLKYLMHHHTEVFRRLRESNYVDASVTRTVLDVKRERKCGAIQFWLVQPKVSNLRHLFCPIELIERTFIPCLLHGVAQIFA